MCLCGALGCRKEKPQPAPAPKPAPIIHGTHASRLKGFRDCRAALYAVVFWSLMSPEESQRIHDSHPDAPSIFDMKRPPTRDEMRRITELTAESFKAAGQSASCAEKVVHYYAGCAASFNTMDRWPEAQREAISGLLAELAQKQLSGTLTEDFQQRIENDVRAAARDSLRRTGGALECADAVTHTMIITAASSSMGAMAPVPAPVNPREDEEVETPENAPPDNHLKDTPKQDQ